MTVEPIRPSAAVQAYLPSVASTPIPEVIATLRAWASTYQEVAEFVAPLIETPFVPESYRPQVPARASEEDHRAAREVAVATATAAVIYGAALGFDPLTALQNVYVVKGRPGLYAAAMVAITQAAGHEIRTEEITDTRAVVVGRRFGRGPEERVAVTMDMARRAGWTASNPTYGKDPQAMLWSRAASRLCRHIAQDALKGLGASVEEMIDGDETSPSPTVRTVTREPLAALPGEVEPAALAEPKATRPRKKTAAPKPSAGSGLPPLPGEDDAGEQAAEPVTEAPPLPGETGELASGEQLARIMNGFADLGLATPAECRGYVERVLGREVADPAKMTTAEAAAVIDALMGPPSDADADGPTDDDGQGTLDEADESS